MKESTAIAIVLFAILVLVTTVVTYGHAVNVYGSTLEKESLPMNVSGSALPMNLTADAEDIDITIDPLEDISSPNGTQTISNTGATDLDINEFPPEGVTIVIENKTTTVTENPVTIGDPVNAQIAEQAPAAIQEEASEVIPPEEEEE
jgi:hypothetical protein